MQNIFDGLQSGVVQLPDRLETVEDLDQFFGILKKLDGRLEFVSFASFLLI
jgi:hypothetical protein